MKVEKQSGVTRDEAGNVEYRGQKFPGFGQPIRASKGKQGKVLVRRGDRIRIVRFGDPSLRDNQSVEQNDRFYARFGGDSNIDDPFSPLYWSARWLWPRGKLKGKGPRPFATLKKQFMTEQDLQKQDDLTSSSEHVEDGIESIERSVNEEDTRSTLVAKLAQFLDRHFGNEASVSDEFDMKPEDVMVIKQFQDEEMVEYAPLYKAANQPDLVGDAMSQHTIDNMVSQLNKAIEDGVQLENLGHKVPIKNAWKYQEVFTSPWPSCMVGDTEVTKGQPVLVIKYNNERAWELRKQGVIKGPSIGGRGRFVENTDD